MAARATRQAGRARRAAGRVCRGGGTTACARPARRPPPARARSPGPVRSRAAAARDQAESAPRRPPGAAESRPPGGGRRRTESVPGEAEGAASARRRWHRRPPPDPNAPPPPPPPPPPITLKLIGIVQGSGKPIAALSDGKDVFFGREGDIIEGRYKIIKVERREHRHRLRRRAGAAPPGPERVAGASLAAGGPAGPRRPDWIGGLV